MKTLIKNLFFIGIGVAFFASCKKDENIDYFNGGTAPVLTASLSGTIPLSNSTATNVAVTFSWTNPNYAFTTGISSQNVSYLLEIDTLGANFTSPLHISTSISPDLGTAYVDGILNSLLSNQMLLAVNVKHTIQVRVTASLNSVTNTKLVSNVLQFSVTPWIPPPTVTPPASGTLFIVGSAVPVSGWNNPITGGSSQAALQQFTKVSNTLYTITIALLGGGSYQFVPVNGSWNGQCGIPVKNDPAEVNGGVFTSTSANDILGPSVDGTYKITVDFQTGRFTVVKQ